jgi:hypothetical protein
VSGEILALAGRRVFLCAADGPRLDGRGVSDLIGALFGSETNTVAIPVGRLGADFLDLRTGLAGEVLQKLVNYRYRVAILGDIIEALAASKSLQDFVRESNRGATVWFVADLAALERKLAGEARA